MAIDEGAWTVQSQLCARQRGSPTVLWWTGCVRSRSPRIPLSLRDPFLGQTQARRATHATSFMAPRRISTQSGWIMKSADCRSGGLPEPILFINALEMSGQRESPRAGSALGLQYLEKTREILLGRNDLAK